MGANGIIALELTDPADADFELMADIQSECTAAWAPDEPPIPGAEIAADVRCSAAHSPVRAFVVGDAGYALVEVPSGGSNEHLAYAWDVEVRPGARRRGAGTALLETVADALRASGRSTVFATTRVGDDGSAAFCRAAGFRPDLVENVNRCATARIDRALLESWVADAPASASGYSLVTFDGAVGDDLLLDVATVAQAMNDAPHSESEEPWALSPENERAGQDAWVAMGYEILTACVRHDETGELAGYTQLLVNPFRPWLAYQQNTGVLAAHRGHRIGQWIKAVNALRLLDQHAQVTTIETGNAASNAHMLAINHAMGFELWAAHQGWELDL